jgi:hypothetical protein
VRKSTVQTAEIITEAAEVVHDKFCKVYKTEVLKEKLRSEK